MRDFIDHFEQGERTRISGSDTPGFRVKIIDARADSLALTKRKPAIAKRYRPSWRLNPKCFPTQILQGFVITQLDARAFRKWRLGGIEEDSSQIPFPTLSFRECGGSFYGCQIEPFSPVSSWQKMSLKNAKTAHSIANFAGIILIFEAIESASTVDEQTSWFENVQNVIKDVPLSLLAHHHIFQAPILSGIFLLAEHTFARAGHIRQKNIDLTRQSAKIGWIVLSYNALRSAFGLSHHPLLHVFGKHLCPFCNRLITDEGRTFRQKTLQKRAFPTWSGTQIERQQRLSRRHELLQNLGDIHRGSLLNIVGSSMKQRVESESGPFLQIERIWAPRYGLEVRIVSQNRFGREFARVQTNGNLRIRRLQSLAKAVCSCPVEVFMHESHKIFWYFHFHLCKNYHFSPQRYTYFTT